MVIYCRNCDEEITFDNYHRSESGKNIPLDVDSNEPHSCSDYSGSIYCHLCNAEITFDDEHISEKTGKNIPIDIDTGDPHDCPVWKTQHRKYYNCNKGCGSQIYFDKSHMSKNNKYIPLDKATGQAHSCGEDDTF
jgi:hypothetical protein